MINRCLILLFLASTAAIAAPVVRKAAEQPLTTAAAIRQLTPDEATARRPIKVRGVITFVSQVPPMFFMQDDTGGVCVTGRRDPDLRLQLKVGTEVEVEGVTAAGKLVPSITGKQKDPIKITVLGEAPLPAAQQLTFARAASSDLHGDLIEVEGVVRSFRTESLGTANLDALVVTLASGTQRMEVAYLAWHDTNPYPMQLIGATVRVRGVFNSSTNDRLTAAQMRLLVPAIKEIRVIDAAQPVSDMPVSSIAELRSSESLPGRVRVKGAVTLAVAGKGLFLQADSVGLWVDLPAARVTVGNHLDVAGFPVRRGLALAIEDPVWKSQPTTGLPDAPLITAEQALASDFDARLVRMEALVLEVSRLSEGPTLVLQSGERVFLARVAGAVSAPLDSLRQDSWVRVTGVCVHNRMPDATASASVATGHHPVTFHLLLATPAAVDVIRAPGWWTLQRIILLLCGLGLVAMAAFGWVVALRVRVARQTGLIRDHLARETLYEERVRIARELHDSLEQDLLGISMQLSATEKLLTAPERARESLQLASAMVRRSQAETHRAVWDLRDHRNGKDGLVVTLCDAVSGLQPTAGTRIEVGVNGEQRPLAPQTENHLLRIALESVTNALKHARPNKISVNLTYAPTEVALQVKDDGEGFDPNHAPPPTSGHFGLFGMRERAEKLRGELKIDSVRGQGTTISLTIPTAQHE